MTNLLYFSVRILFSPLVLILGSYLCGGSSSMNLMPFPNCIGHTVLKLNWTYQLCVSIWKLCFGPQCKKNTTSWIYNATRVKILHHQYKIYHLHIEANSDTITIHIVAEMFVTSEFLWLVWVRDVQRHSNSEILFYYVLQSIIVQCQCYQVASPQSSSYKNYHTTTTFMSSGVSDSPLWKRGWEQHWKLPNR